jgi:hypothetical protein
VTNPRRRATRWQTLAQLLSHRRPAALHSICPCNVGWGPIVGSSWVLLRKKGTWGGPAGGVERTRSTGSCAAGDRPVRAVGTPGCRSSDARAFQPPPDPRHLRWVPPPTARRRHAASAPRRPPVPTAQTRSQTRHAARWRARLPPGSPCGPAVSSSGRARGPTIPIHWQVPLEAFVLAPSDDTVTVGSS